MKPNQFGTPGGAPGMLGPAQAPKWIEARFVRQFIAGNLLCFASNHGARNSHCVYPPSRKRTTLLLQADRQQSVRNGHNGSEQVPLSGGRFFHHDPALAMPYDRPSVAAIVCRCRFPTVLHQAQAWLRLVRHLPGLTPDYLLTKFLESLGFTLRLGLPAFAVASKLDGTSAYQGTVRDLRGEKSGVRFDARIEGPHVVLYYQGRPIGRIQSKHLPWVLRLLPLGLTIHLLRVSGDESRGMTLGVNIFLMIGDAALRSEEVEDVQGGLHEDDDEGEALPAAA
jgi:hypothetical protein